MRSSKTNFRLLAGVAILGILAGCAETPLGKGPERLGDKTIRERSPSAAMQADEALNLFREKPITVLETDNRHSFAIAMDAGEVVPSVTVGEINASPMNFAELLNQITEQVGMSWAITGKNKNDLMSQDIYFVQRSETMLDSVLEEVSKMTNSFYRVEGDRIIFSQDELFVTNVPRMADSQDVLQNGIANVGAQEVFADKLSGTISFRADRGTLAAVQTLMRSFENGRDMIVYDFWIIERSLDDNAGIGVDIDAELTTGDGVLGLEEPGASGLVEAIASGALEKVFFTGNLGNVGVQFAASMIRSLGETETLARPTISMLSGAESSFESGQRSEYIRSVNETILDGSSTSGTDVQQLSVGIKVDVAGSHNGGVISTDFVLDISELIAFDEFDTGSVRLRLPRTSQRKLTAHLEARPGDVLALGGIIRDREEKDERGIGPNGIPVARSSGSEKTETIILVRPRLVQIRPGKSSKPGEILRIESGVSKAPNALGEVISDEARTKRILEELKSK
jgi:type II secretory pathway component GspD/PulD (secretin)